MQLDHLVIKSRRAAGIQSHIRPVPKHEMRPFKGQNIKHKKKSPARDLTKVILRAHAPSSPVASSKPGAASPPSTGSFPSGPSEHVGRKHADFRSARMRSKSPSMTAKSPLQPDSRAYSASKVGGVSLWND
ncbi:hypothetical protein DY000_02013390 [Brassica cretica]|uniref:DUF4005 domain-containing protein n=1 Tax=Brassica cretica TaxID=69181 RepID=A0ABQ7D3B2_BRACR|nr:hypothetical protein DY000_02013390 [Brassica cretica]